MPTPNKTKEERKDCCDKCYSWYDPIAEPEGPFCKNLKCDCHAPFIPADREEEKYMPGDLRQVNKKVTFHSSPPEWEKEFERQFTSNGMYWVFEDNQQASILKVKSFIASTLKAEHVRLWEKLQEMKDPSNYKIIDEILLHLKVD